MKGFTMFCTWYICLPLDFKLLNLAACMLLSMINVRLISEKRWPFKYVNYVIMTRSGLYLYFTHINILT